MKFLVFLSCLTLITSCTIEKRLYRPGYHIESSLFSRSVAESEHKHEPRKLKSRQEESPQFDTKDLQRTLEVKPLLANYTNPCDTIVKKNGDKLIVKVETISESKVTYRKCDNLSGPIYEESLVKVDYLSFANGKVEKIDSQSLNNNDYNTSAPSAQNSSQPGDVTQIKKPIEIFGLASFLSLGLCIAMGNFAPTPGLVLFIASIVLAIVSLVRFKDNPQKFGGRWMPITVLVLIGLGLISLLILFSTLFAAFG